MLTAPGTRHAIPTTTEGSAIAIPAVDSPLALLSEESVDSTKLAVGDLAVSMLDEEDRPVAISGSTIKSLSILDEAFCVLRKRLIIAPRMLGDYRRCWMMLARNP